MTTSPPNVITRRDVWQSAWRVASGDRLLAASLMGLAVALAVAALLPQAPQGDSAAYARWLSDTQLRFGSASSALSGLGLFDVVHSLLFRIPAGIAGFALFARLLDRALHMRATPHPVPPPESPAQIRDSALAPDALSARLRGWRVLHGESFTMANRFPRAAIGPMVAYAGALLMLLGLMLSPLIDWRVDAFSALPDTLSAIPNTPYALQVNAIDAGGRIELAIRQGEQDVLRGFAAAGQPLLGGAASVFVRELLPALHVSGRDADGLPLDLQTSAQGQATPALLLAFDAGQPDEFFVAPEVLLAVRVSSLDAGAAENRYEVSIVRGADASQVARETIAPGHGVAADGAYFEFEGASHAVLSIVYAPAQIVIVAGLIVAVVGLAIAAVFPAQRVWIIAQASGARVMSDDPHADLDRLTTDRAS